MTQQTILLTGSSGVVGTALLHALTDHPVIALVHRKPVSAPSIRGDITQPWLGLHPHDYRHLAHKVAVVVHSAASVDFGQTPDTLHDSNVRGTGRILRFVADAHARLVHEAYAELGDGPRDHLVTCGDAVNDLVLKDFCICLHVSSALIARVESFHRLEQDPTRTTQTPATYLRSKILAETLVRESGLPAVTARLSTVSGDSTTGRISRLQAFPYLIGAAMRGRIPFLPATPSTKIDLIPQDVAAATLVALATAELDRGLYWITSGPSAPTLQQIIDLGEQVVRQRLRQQYGRPMLATSLLKTRLINPQTCDEIIKMVLAAAGPDAQPSRLKDLVGLMTAFNNTESFPTSLGAIPGAPRLLTNIEMESAITALCEYLTGLPNETWTVLGL